MYVPYYCTILILLHSYKKCMCNNGFDGKGWYIPDEILVQVKMVSNMSQLIGRTLLFCLSLILKNRLQHLCVVYFVLSDVLCTFRCTLYFHVWKYRVHPKVHEDVGINIFSTRNKKRVQSTLESTFMYFRMYCVLLIVLCTFKCTLKSTRCTLKTVGNQDWKFSKKQ